MMLDKRRTTNILPFSKIWFLFLVVFLFFIFLSTWLIVYVPANMDEFLPYHRIACATFSNSVEHILTESCSAFPSRILGFDFYRNYSYVGFSSNLLYWPFYKVLAAPSSHHFLGVLVLVGFSILLVKAFSLSTYTIVIPLIYFPLLFQVVHDTGPIRIALLSYSIITILACRIFSPKTTNFQMVLLLLSTFVIYFFAIEDKPFYVFLIPQITLLSFWTAYDSYSRNNINFKSKIQTVKLKINTRIPPNLLYILLIFIIFAACFVALFLTTTPDYQTGNFHPYIASLIKNSSSRLTFSEELKQIVLYLITPIRFTNRIYELSIDQHLISIIAFFPVLCIFLYAAFAKEYRNWVFILLSLFLLVFIFLLMRMTWSGHHFIYLHIPILIFLMIYASNGTRRYIQVIIALVLSALVSWSQVYSAKEGIHSESGRKNIFYYLSQKEIASESIINFTSWGGYSQQSLYGSNLQLVTHILPTNSDTMKPIIELWVKTGKKYLINVCYNCDESTFYEYFPASKILMLNFPMTSWRLIRIEKQE